MQNGSVVRAERQRGPDVWEFRWREPGADGKRKHRRMILGSIEQLADETAARQAIATLRLDLNHGDAWLKTRSTTVSELAAHYRERNSRSIGHLTLTDADFCDLMVSLCVEAVMTRHLRNIQRRYRQNLAVVVSRGQVH
jgi:hypothetical protein